MNNLEKNAIKVLSVNAVVGRTLHKCVKCRKLRGMFETRKCQICQKIDAGKQFYAHIVVWSCLGQSPSEREGRILCNTVPYSHVPLVQQFILRELAQ